MKSVFCLAAGLLLTAAQAPSSSTYDRGVEARLAGQFDAAERLLAQAVASAPNNADAQLQLGLVYLAQQRLDDAEARFERVLALAPDYADARIGLARVAERRGRRDQALQWLGSIPASNAEAAELRARLGSTPRDHATRIDVDLGASAVENQPDWREASLQISHRLTDSSNLSARIEASRRFGTGDVFGELRLDHRIDPGLSFWLSAGATPNADFRPRWQVAGGLAARVRGGPQATVLTVDAIQARYRSGDIQTLTPGVEQYFAGGRVWATLRWVNIFGEDGDHESGWLARGDFRPNDHLRLFAGATDAPDVSEGVVTETFGLFGGMVADLSDRMQLRFSMSHEDRSTGDRLSGSIGLGWRF